MERKDRTLPQNLEMSASVKPDRASSEERLLLAAMMRLRNLGQGGNDPQPQELQEIATACLAGQYLAIKDKNPSLFTRFGNVLRFLLPWVTKNVSIPVEVQFPSQEQPR